MEPKGCPGGSDFNPRSPWGERQTRDGVNGISVLFQSTLPVGGATRRRLRGNVHPRDFNPRSPWGERHGLVDAVVGAEDISIHAPRGGSDSKDAQFYLRIFGEKVNFECYFLVNSRCQPVP